MAVKIRLMRVGKKKQPSYRVVVVEESKKRDGAVIQVIGHYQPLHPSDQLTLDVEQALLWLERGAQPSDSVRSLLSKAGVLKVREERRLGKADASGA